MLVNLKRYKKTVLSICVSLALGHLFWSLWPLSRQLSEREADIGENCTLLCDDQEQLPLGHPRTDGSARLCASNGQYIELLMLIHSATEHFGHRSAIRTAIQMQVQHHKWRIVFVLGQSSKGTVNRQVKQEVSAFGDILLGQFADTYRNLTLKHLLGLRWATRHCGQAKSVLKVDDDIFVNYPRLSSLVKQVHKSNASLGSQYLLCYLHREMSVIRDTSSKWAVTKGEFAGQQYPSFCSGWAYLTTISTIKSWLCAAKKPHFWVDDVYVTGFLRKETCQPVTPINHLFNADPSVLASWLATFGSRKWYFLFSNTKDETMLRKALQSNYLVNKRVKSFN